MHGRNLSGVDAVFLNHRAAGEVTYAHDMISLFHTAFFNSKNGRIDVAARAVEVGSMYVDNQWFTADVLSENASRIGEPIVRVDDIKIERVR